MSSESLVGSTYYDGLSEEGQALVDAVLGDTINGEVTTTNIGGGELVVGTGAGGVTQGVVITDAGQAVTAELDAGSLQVGIALPAGMTLAFEGLPAEATPAEAQAYLSGLIEAAYGDSPENATAKYALQNAVSAIFNAFGSGAGDVKVNLVFLNDTGSGTTPTGTAIGPNDVLFTGQSDSDEVLAFVMNQLSPGKTLVLENVASAVLLGSGTTRVEGSAPTVLSGDLANQNITGGTGNDTLVGGGGNDTLTGGAGADVFGLNVATGTLTLSDFNVAEDKLAFALEEGLNINSWNDVAPYFTGLTQDGGNTTAHFGSYVNITFVGVSAEDLTTNILKFDLS